MAEHLQQAVNDVSRLAAAGEFTSARRHLTDFLSGHPELGRAHFDALRDQRRTLEVLESLDVIRRLLADGDTATVVDTAEGLREALAGDEYAKLGVLGAALALLGRAAELARRAESGEATPLLREQIAAFTEHLANELDLLQHEQVQGRLEQVLTAPEHASATLGELLRRRPGRSNLMSGVRTAEVEREPPEDGPVIGRILIEQEQRERVAPAPQTATAPAPAGDLFELVGTAALRYWHIVGGVALIAAAIGYFVAVAAPDRFESKAVLRRSAPSELSAPLTGRTKTYLTEISGDALMWMASYANFHEGVAERLSNVGWSPDGSPGPEHQFPDMTGGRVAAMLVPMKKNTGGNDFLIELVARAEDERMARAVAGAAAEELRQRYLSEVTAKAVAHLEEFEAQRAITDKELAALAARRLEEFKVEGSIAVGKDVRERIDQLVADRREASARLEAERIRLAAATQEEAALVQIAERIPPFEEMEPGAKLTALEALHVQTEKEFYALAREQTDLGEEHPRQKRIANLQEDLRLIEKEIDELRRAEGADVDRRRVNPLRAAADSRVATAQAATAQSRLTIQSLEERLPKIEAELSGLRELYLPSNALADEEKRLNNHKYHIETTLAEIESVRKNAGLELTLLAPASRPSRVPRQEPVGIAVGLLAGLIIGIGIAAGLLRRRQMLEAEDA